MKRRATRGERVVIQLSKEMAEELKIYAVKKDFSVSYAVERALVESGVVNELEEKVFDPSGFIYVCHTKEEGVLKVGGTSRMPSLRVNEQEGLTLVTAFTSSDWKKHEAAVHRSLKDYRLSAKELFRCSEVKVYDALTVIFGSRVHKRVESLQGALGAADSFEGG